MRSAGLVLVLVGLTGCAGAVSPGARGVGASPLGDSTASATRSAAPAESVLCIGANLNDVQLLGWLAANVDLAGEPWDKLFHEPPLTGPRAGVDTTRYVAFARQLAERTVVRIDTFADGSTAVVPFLQWEADSQAAFVERGWPCIVFDLCDPGECLCGAARWSFASEVP